MAGRGERARAAFFAAIAGSACNGQFDFDNAPLDAGEPPIIVIDGGPDDASLIGDAADAASEGPRTGVHIACGGSDCLIPACCSTSSGSSCVDIGEGGTCSGLVIQCDDTDDCPEGQVCCAEGEDLALPARSGGAVDADHGLLRVHCEPEARCHGTSVILCNPDRPYPCMQCEASSLPGLPPGYHQCAAPP